jgi:hypothetical protein
MRVRLTALVRRRRPAADTKRSQHDFHCQRAKDKAHYTDEDGRALATDHPQNRIRKKQQHVGDEEDHHQDNARFEPLRHRINIVISQDDHRHHRARPGDGRYRQREHREVAPLLRRSIRLRIHFPEQHLHTEQEQNDATGHFERVHVNADRVENDLADSPGGHEDDRGVNHSTQRREMPLFPCERSGQPGEQRHIPDRIDRRPKGSEIFANLDQERRHRSYFLIHPSYFFLPWVRFSLIRTTDQARDKVGLIPTS